jgi:eukaryotic-like serine/threonine-protein kinase
VTHRVLEARPQRRHRDLKPENVLLDQDSNQLLVADFGIADFGQDPLFTDPETSPHRRLANFRYSAPEQRTPGVPVDLRADIYALGLMLNEMFTGEVPQGTGYKLIREARPEWRALDHLVERMLRWDPGLPARVHRRC